MDSQSDPHSPPTTEPEFDLALLSDPGSGRSANEDCCGYYVEGPGTALFAVADGVGGFDGGAVASALAIEVTLESYRENPVEWGTAKRLYRAVQRANVEIHNKALLVPELRRMATTLTAVVVENGTLNAAHVGDCRIYVARRHAITQISQDHTMVAEQVKRGLMSAEHARGHPERSILLRNVGHDLIVSVAKISMPLLQGDRVIVCSDGLYDVIRDHEIEQLSRDLDAAAACKILVDTANHRNTTDNVTCAVFRMIAPTPHQPEPVKTSGWRQRLRSLFSSDS
jgi:serine/threonine protein phosphatase PrpC